MRKKSKQFPCNICEKKFKDNGSLTKHNRIVHTKNRPHVCKFCTKDYKCNRDLMRHITTIHGRQKPHKCTLCEATTKKSFSMHLERVHGNAQFSKKLLP